MKNRPLVQRRYDDVDLAHDMAIKDGTRGYIKVVACYGKRRKTRNFPLVTPLIDRLAWQHQAVEQLRLDSAPAPTADEETIRQAVTAYLGSLTGDRKLRADRALRYWVRWYGDVLRADLTLGMVQAFFEHVTPLAGGTFSNATKNKMRVYLCNVWRYRDGRRHDCPALDMPMLPEEIRESREVTPAVALAILGAMSDSANRARLGLLFCTGMRPGELLRLRPASFHLDEPTPWVAIPTAKGGRPRIVVLPPLGVQYAEDFLRHAAWDRIDNLMRDMQAAAKRAGVWTPPVGAHPSGRKRHAIVPYALRHAYAMNLRRAGADISDIADALGHSSLSTTRRYAQAIPSRQAAMAAAMWEKAGMA
jgi:integrase